MRFFFHFNLLAIASKVQQTHTIKYDCLVASFSFTISVLSCFRNCLQTDCKNKTIFVIACVTKCQRRSLGGAMRYICPRAPRYRGAKMGLAKI